MLKEYITKFFIIFGWRIWIFLIVVQCKGIAFGISIENKYFAVVLHCLAVGLLDHLVVKICLIICHFERFKNLNCFVKVADLTEEFGPKKSIDIHLQKVVDIVHVIYPLFYRDIRLLHITVTVVERPKDIDSQDVLFVACGLQLSECMLEIFQWQIASTASIVIACACLNI